MKKRQHPGWEHFKFLGFVVFLLELVVFFMGLLFRRILGYQSALVVSFWLGVIVGACFASIVFVDLGLTFIARSVEKISRRR